MSYLLAESYLHRLDPFVFHVTEDFGPRWYGLSYAFGFLIGWALLRWLSKSGRIWMTTRDVGDFLVWMMAGVLIGGRLGYALFYDQSMLGFSSDPPFWNFLAVHRGGMASHGGMIGVIAAAVLFARRRGKPALPMLDGIALAGTIGLGVGRVANFINGELPGKALAADAQSNVGGLSPWWSVKYPAEVLSWGDDPARLSVLRELTSLAPSEAGFLERVQRALLDGQEAATALVQPMLTAFYPSQLIQALTDGPILLGVLLLIWLRPRKPGVIGSWFLIGYGVLRILTEIVRQPDEGVELLLGMQRGQLLSVLMVVIGLICLVVVTRLDADSQKGLLKVKESK